VHATRDIREAALEIRDAVHEQHGDIDQGMAEILGDANFIAREATHDRARGTEQTHPVPGFDPELLRKWLPLHSSHGPRIMQPPVERSNRMAQSSFNSACRLDIVLIPLLPYFCESSYEYDPSPPRFSGLVKCLSAGRPIS
jgi:hypothetical protein